MARRCRVENSSDGRRLTIGAGPWFDGAVINATNPIQLPKSAPLKPGARIDTFGPLGPWLVTRDEVPDPSNLHLWLEVNGRRYQDGSTATMVYKPAFLVSYLSNFMSLCPGDVIATGTPPGVGIGQKPPVFLKQGDVVELGVEGLGVQRQRVVSD